MRNRTPGARAPVADRPRVAIELSCPGSSLQAASRPKYRPGKLTSFIRAPSVTSKSECDRHRYRRWKALTRTALAALQVHRASHALCSRDAADVRCEFAHGQLLHRAKRTCTAVRTCIARSLRPSRESACSGCTTSSRARPVRVQRAAHRHGRPAAERSYPRLRG